MLLFALLAGNLLLSLLILLSIAPNRAPDAPLLTLFQRTIVDAERPNPMHISDQLFALAADNRKLQWQEFEGERWVKVVSWQSNLTVNRYYNSADVTQRHPIKGVTLWVTLAPQVQEFCRGLPRDHDPAFRLKQYLGLNPSRRYERFVELWVRPQHLFRPCVDPDPGDRRCELELSPDQPPPQVAGIADYRQWLAEMRRQSYQPNGAPWTRLGYTYDWQYGAWGVGASEYILTPDAEYRLEASYPTDLYCGYPATPYQPADTTEPTRL